MRKTFKLGSWLAAIGLAVSGLAAPAAQAQDCQTGDALALLDINNVRAPIYNNGSLFYPDVNGVHYEVPKGSGLSPNYATNVWVGGQAGGELRIAAATYAQSTGYEYFPGPLPASGAPLSRAQCETYDRIWKINLSEVKALDRGEAPSKDIAEWPWQIGAPVIDGDGVPGNYNLAGGDRPEVLGDQTLWWVMNDASGPHLETQSPAVGVEIQVTAFAFRTAEPVNSMTFYRYKLVYKPVDNKPLTNTYLAVWADTDLGDATDDYVGVDTTLGLGYTYNADNADAGAGGYGSTQLPAFGIDFFQGPLVSAPGKTFRDPDGKVHTDSTRLGTTRFVYYNNINNVPTGNPNTGLDFYRYMSGFWLDGQPLTLGGTGRGGTTPTNFMFPGNPPAFWSEDNNGNGANTPDDRRFIISTGPFTLNPGDTQTIVFGMVFSRGSDRFAALNKLKADDDFAQRVFDTNFKPTIPPDPVDSLNISEQDRRLVLSFTNLPTNNNFQNRYEAKDVFIAAGEPDSTYQFEGYRIYQLRDRSDAVGRLIKSFDVKNGIKTVVDTYQDPTTQQTLSQVVFNGDDAGIENFFTVTTDAFSGGPLRNYTEYCFSIVPFGYNAASSPKLILGSPTVQCGVPQQTRGLAGGQIINGASGDTLAVTRAGTLKSEGALVARVADPLALTGDTYQVRFDTVMVDGQAITTYSLLNTTKGTTLFNGKTYSRRTKQAPAYGENVFVYDGISFSVSNPAPGIKAFLTTHNATTTLTGVGGALNCDFNTICYPSPTLPTPDLTGLTGYWAINLHALLTSGYRPYSTFETYGIGSAYSNNTTEDRIGAHDFEIRFTAAGSVAGVRRGYPYEDTPAFGVGSVPFELWDTGIGTPNDPSDDVRLVPYFRDYPEVGTTTYNNVFNLRAVDHEASGGDNDPLTEPFWWGIPAITTPGQAGYLAEVAALQANPAGYTFRPSVFAFMSLVNINGGSVSATPFAPNQLMPPTGTVYRIETNKPFQPGEVLVINTAPEAPTRGDAATAVAALDDIGIVPNPYRGRSDYDVSAFQSQVRLVNIPAGGLVRVYTLSGQLIKTFTSGGEDFIPWDLRSDAGLSIASGLYLVHVDVPGVGQKIIKFGVVQRRIQLDTF